MIQYKIRKKIDKLYEICRLYCENELRSTYLVDDTKNIIPKVIRIISTNNNFYNENLIFYINHQNVVEIIHNKDNNEKKNEHLIIRKYYKGCDLKQCIQDEKFRYIEQKVDLFYNVCNLVNDINEKLEKQKRINYNGFISPSSIVCKKININDGPKIKFIGYDICQIRLKCIENNPNQFELIDKLLENKVPYLAPEIIKTISNTLQENKYYEKADVFSIAAIFYEVFTGEELLSNKSRSRDNALNNKREKETISEKLSKGFFNKYPDLKNILEQMLESDHNSRINFNEAKNEIDNFKKKLFNKLS